MRNILYRINSQVNRFLAPSKASRNSTYRNILSEVEFERALHFGSGRDKRKLVSSLDSEDIEIIALDPDKDGLRRNQNQHRICGDGQRLPFKDNTFDLVFSEYVFEHLPNPDDALDEIDRVLNPGGSFVVVVPNPRHYYAKIADLTPFWFHLLYFKSQGIDSLEQDRFPTQYKWGTYSDIHEVEQNWKLNSFQSFPGPTGYTMILPFHIIFVLIDRVLANYPKYHVCYIAHYKCSTN